MKIQILHINVMKLQYRLVIMFITSIINLFIHKADVLKFKLLLRDHALIISDIDTLRLE